MRFSPPTDRRARRWIRFAIPFLLLWAQLAITSDAQAWTEAEVETLEAVLHLSEDAQVRVDIALRLHVHGGWLERLEVAGLDEGYTLDEESIRFRGENGERFHPRVRRRDDGRLQFGFPRRGSPRRGHYEVRFAYVASIAPSARPEGERVRYEWTLPGWRTGLDGVRITIRGPRGLTFAESEDSLVTIARTRTEENGESLLHWQRAHLPRTVPWSVGFTVPASQAPADAPWANETATDAPAASEPTEATPQEPETPPLLWLALLSAIAVWLFGGQANRYGVHPRGVVPLPRGLRVLGLLGLTAYAYAESRGWSPASGWLGLSLATALALERTPQVGPPPHLGSWRPLQAQGALPVWHRPWDGLFDGTRPMGWFTFGALFAYLYGQRTFDATMLTLCIPWLTGTVAQLPMSLQEKRTHLLRLANGFRASGRVPFAFGLAVHEAAHGDTASSTEADRDPVSRYAQAVRLRVATVERARGLIRFDVVCGERQGPGGLHASLQILVVTREDSEADAIATRLFQRTSGHRTPGGRNVWSAPLSELERLVQHLGQNTPRAKRRRQQQPAATPNVPQLHC